jgi:hypothetical protein
MKRFTNVAQFQKYLYERTATLAAAEAKGLDKVGDMVARDAKRRIGRYQDEVGQFPEWKELADATKADRVQQGFSKNDPLLRTGDMRDSVEFSRESDRVTIGSTSKIALWQELGTSESKHPIPPRPFLGPALFVNAEEAAKTVAEEVAIWLVGGIKPNRW